MNQLEEGIWLIINDNHGHRSSLLVKLSDLPKIHPNYIVVKAAWKEQIIQHIIDRTEENGRYSIDDVANWACEKIAELIEIKEG